MQSNSEEKCLFFYYYAFLAPKTKCFFFHCRKGSQKMDSLYTKNRGKLDNVLFFIIWPKQLFEFQSLFIYQSELNPHYLPGRHPLPQSTLTFLPLFPHCSPPYSSLCSPASFLLLTCAKIRGRTWGFIDFWSCEMTSLVSDLPVYIWFTASCLWSQRKGDNKRQEAPIFPRLEEMVSCYFCTAACTGIYTLNLLCPQHTIVWGCVG